MKAKTMSSAIMINDVPREVTGPITRSMTRRMRHQQKIMKIIREMKIRKCVVELTKPMVILDGRTPLILGSSQGAADPNAIRSHEKSQTSPNQHLANFLAGSHLKNLQIGGKVLIPKMSREYLMKNGCNLLPSMPKDEGDKCYSDITGTGQKGRGGNVTADYILQSTATDSAIESEGPNDPNTQDGGSNDLCVHVMENAGGNLPFTVINAVLDEDILLVKKSIEFMLMHADKMSSSIVELQKEMQAFIKTHHSNSPKLADLNPCRKLQSDDIKATIGTCGENHQEKKKELIGKPGKNAGINSDTGLWVNFRKGFIGLFMCCS